MKRFVAGIVVGMVLAASVAYAAQNGPITGQEFNSGPRHGEVCT